MRSICSPGPCMQLAGCLATGNISPDPCMSASGQNCTRPSSLRRVGQGTSRLAGGTGRLIMVVVTVNAFDLGRKHQRPNSQTPPYPGQPT